MHKKKQSREADQRSFKGLFPGLFLLLLLVLSVGTASGQSGRTTHRQGKPEDSDVIRVATEEVKLNVSAFNPEGRFHSGLGLDDIVILEDGIIHPPASVRRVSSNVILILDTGGEDRQAKDFATTKEAAKELIRRLSDDASFSVIESSDSARILIEWTADKDAVIKGIDRQLNFGRRSMLVKSLTLALDFFEKTELENRHIVLISDGLDSVSSDSERNHILNRILATDISVHVVSYTKMEQKVANDRKKPVRQGPPPPPPGSAPPIQGTTPTSTIASINLDREMTRKINERLDRLRSSEKSLSTIASSTGGEFILPSSREELVESMEYLARLMDSFYVVTYTPKRPLAGALKGEQRTVRVSSRKGNILIEANRKIVVR